MEKKKIMKNSLIIAATLATTMTIFPRNISKAAIDEELGLTYSAHVQNRGWMSTVQASDSEINAILAGTTGQSLRAEGFVINFRGPENVNVKYNVHSQNKGWTGWKTSGQLAGTTGEGLRAEAIKISVEGLDEYGYQLKYRAHVENIGWMNWVTADNSQDLTINYAGTTGQSLRIEAIEIVLIQSKTQEPDEGEQLKLQKEECISELNKYLVALGTTVDEDEPSTETKYNAISAKIETAKTAILEAEKIEEVTEKFDKIVDEIISAYPNAEELAVKVATEAAAEKEKVAKEIKIYKEKLQTADLLDSTKNVISQVIEKAENKIEVAQTADDVNTAFTNMENLLKNYSDYRLSVLKEMAINDLTELLDGANKGTTNAINTAIEQINTGKINGVNITDETLANLVTTVTNNANTLKAAQIIAEKELKLYEDAVKASNNITSASKAIINNQIKKVREQIDAETLSTKIDGTEGTIMYTFRNYMNTYYSTVVDKKADIALEAQKQEAINKYNEYVMCGYTDVKEAAEGFIAKLTNPEENSTTLEKELGDLTTNLTTLSGMKEDAEAEEQRLQRAYTTNYNNAIDELNKYNEILNSTEGLDLTASEVEELRSLVKNTKANIEATKPTKNTNGITTAMKMFEDYIGLHYPNIESEADANRVTKAKETANKALADYVESENEDVSRLANTAISEIESLDDATEINTTCALAIAKADAIIELADLKELYGEIDGVSTIISTAKTNIINATTVEDIENEGADPTLGVTSILENARENVENTVEEKAEETALVNAKQNAVRELKAYLSNANTEVVAKAKKAISDIYACTSINDIKNEGTDPTPGVTTILNTAKREIQAILGTPTNELTEAKEQALATIKNYNDMAVELGYTTLINDLSLYKTAVEEAASEKNVARINELDAEIKNYVRNNYSLLNTKVTTINGLKNTYLEAQNVSKYVNYTEYTTIVNSAISEIKAQETDTAEKITAITTQLKTDTDAEKLEIDTYETAKGNAITEITQYVTTKTESAEVAVKTAVEGLANIFKSDVNAKTYAQYLAYKAEHENDEQSTTVFTTIIADAKTAIDAYMAPGE